MEKDDKEMIDQEVEDNSIQWLGIDGLLIGLLFFLIAIGFISLKYKVDILSGYIFPLILLIIVVVVAVSYAKTLGTFIKTQNAQMKKNKVEKLNIRNGK